MPDQIPHRRLYAWLLAAVSAPLAHYCGNGWVAVGLAAGAMLPLTMMFSGGWRSMGKWVSGLQFLFLIVVMGYLVRAAGDYWPSGETGWAVPVTLLALAAVSAGGDKASRAGSAVAWLMILLAIPLLTAGAAQVRMDRLRPYRADWPSGLLVALLIPALGNVWNTEGTGSFSSRLGVALLAVVPAALAQGILSGTVARSQQTPFYEMARTMYLWGGRWEPLAAMAVTLGWYALCSFLTATACGFGTAAGIPEKWCPWLVFSAAAAFVWFRVQLNGVFVLVAALVLWVLTPMLHEIILPKKDEKSA